MNKHATHSFIVSDGLPMTARRLRQIRISLNWTQEHAAYRLGISLRAYKYLEAGETSTATASGDYAKRKYVPTSIALAMLTFKHEHVSA